MSELRLGPPVVPMEAAPSFLAVNTTPAMPPRLGGDLPAPLSAYPAVAGMADARSVALLAAPDSPVSNSRLPRGPEQYSWAYWLPGTRIGDRYIQVPMTRLPTAEDFRTDVPPQWVHHGPPGWPAEQSQPADPAPRHEPEMPVSNHHAGKVPVEPARPPSDLASNPARPRKPRQGRSAESLALGFCFKKQKGKLTKSAHAMRRLIENPNGYDISKLSRSRQAIVELYFKRFAKALKEKLLVEGLTYRLEETLRVSLLPQLAAKDAE